MDATNPSRRIFNLFLLIALLSRLVLSQGSRPTNDVQALELKRPIERAMTTGEVHSYSVQVTAGQVLDVVVDQRGIDVVVNILAPDGTTLMELDSPNGTEGPEP